MGQHGSWFRLRPRPFSSWVSSFRPSTTVTLWRMAAARMYALGVIWAVSARAEMLAYCSGVSRTVIRISLICFKIYLLRCCVKWGHGGHPRTVPRPTTSDGRSACPRRRSEIRSDSGRPPVAGNPRLRSFAPPLPTKPKGGFAGAPFCARHKRSTKAAYCVCVVRRVHSRQAPLKRTQWRTQPGTGLLRRRRQPGNGLNTLPPYPLGRTPPAGGSTSGRPGGRRSRPGSAWQSSASAPRCPAWTRG